MTEPLSEGLVRRLSDAALAAGDPVFSRYEIRERLGEGAMAVVHRAYDRQLQRIVALKILRSSGDSYPGLRERFQREAQATAKLAHPNIVTLYDYGEENGQLFIVMESIQGETLERALAAKRYDLPALIGLLEKVGRAVHVAHSYGIVHRDLKPQNILVTSKGEPKVADFGLARVENAGRLTKTGAVAGTPMYMSPEQVRGDTERVGPRSDIYALGAILYQVVAGRAPHEADSIEALYQKILFDEPARIQPVDLEKIALKALQKDPEDRYASANDFAEDLRRYLAGEPIAARRAGSHRRAFKWLAAHQVWVVAAAVLLAAIPIGVSLRSARRLEEQVLEENRRRSLLARFEEKLRHAEKVVYDTRSVFYEKDAPFELRLAELDREMEDFALQLAASPGSEIAEGWAILGIGRYLLGDRDEAEASLLRADKLGRKDGEVAYYLGKIYLEHTMMEEFGLGERQARVDEREKEWQAKAELYLRRPFVPGTHSGEMERDIIEVYHLLAQNNRPEVRRRAAAGIEKYKGAWGAEEYRNLSGFVRSRDNPKARHGDYDEALKIRPHYAWGLLMRGGASHQLSNYAAAIADFDHAAKLNPRSGPIFAFRASVKREAGDLAGALIDAETAIRLAPEFVLGRLVRGTVFHTGRKWIEARLDFDEVIRRVPDGAKPYGLRARVSMEEKKFESAEEDLSRAIELQPAWDEPHVLRAEVREVLKNYPAALEDWNRALELSKGHHNVQTGRGMFKARRGNKTGAIRDLETALKNAPADWPKRAEVEDALQRLRSH